MKSLAPLIAFFLSVLSWTSTYSMVVLNGPNLNSSGGAGRATVIPLETPFVNPAALPHISTGAHFGFQYNDGYLGPAYHLTQTSVAATDASYGNVMPGALRYTRNRTMLPSNERWNHEIWEVALGEFALRNLAVGVGGQLRSSESDRGKDYKQWDASVGLLYTPIASLGLGLTYNDFTLPGGDLPPQIEAIATLGIGAQYLFQEFWRVKADLLLPKRQNPESKKVLQLGSETVLMEFMAVRLGAEFNEWLDRTLWTAGFGFEGPNLKMAYSFQKNQEGTGAALHSVDFRIAF